MQKAPNIANTGKNVSTKHTIAHSGINTWILIKYSPICYHCNLQLTSYHLLSLLSTGLLPFWNLLIQFSHNRSHGQNCSSEFGFVYKIMRSIETQLEWGGGCWGRHSSLLYGQGVGKVSRPSQRVNGVHGNCYVVQMSWISDPSPAMCTVPVMGGCQNQGNITKMNKSFPRIWRMLQGPNAVDRIGAYGHR